MRQRIVALIGALALAVVGLIALSAPAQATDANGVCETGELCMWKDARTGNGRYDSFYGIPNFNTKAFRAACQADCGLNDNITSLRNKDANKNVRLWEHTNYSGGVFWRKWYNTTDRYDEADDLSLNSFSNGVNANDEVSSFCFVYPSNPVSQCRGPVR